MFSALRCLPLALALGACSNSTSLLPPGAPAPDLVGMSADGAMVRLSDQRGRYVVVYFYPKDATPGCTTEACAFRDAYTRYEQRHVMIFGVSRDDSASHQKFRAEHQLPFPLVADEDGSVQRAYGVPSWLGMARRVTFLIDAGGKVAKVWPDVDPAVHANEVLSAVPAEHADDHGAPAGAPAPR